jgi:ADP-heptose:LPS heptosyltransferase
MTDCLVIKNDGLGDLVLVSGLIADLAKRFEAVDLLTCEQNRELAEAIPGLRHRLYVSRDAIRLRRLPAWFGIQWVASQAGDREVFDHLDSHEYAVAICLRRFIRQSSLVLMKKTRAREKHCAWLFPTNTSSGVAERLSGGWQRYRAMAYGSELTYYRGFLREALGLESFAPPALALATVGTGAPSVAISRVGLVLGGISTNWPESHWRELAVGLTQLGKKLVLFGGADAQPLAVTLCNLCPNAEDLTGQLGFAQSVAPLRSLELLIGNDTGFTHFAGLVTPRCLVILGGGTFGRFFPWPETTGQYVIFHGMECFDCDWQCKFTTRQCLEAVSAASVMGYVRAILRNEATSVRNLNAAAVTCQVGWRRSTGLGRVTIGTDGSLTPSLGIDHG